MSRSKSLSRLTVAATIAFGASLLLAGADASAAERRGGRGMNRGDTTRETVRQRTDNGRTRSDAWTGPRGTTTRDASVTRDREAGTRTRNAVTTLPDGRTRTLEDVTTRTENGYTRSTTVVNPNGGTVQRDVTATVDPATGVRSKTVTTERTPPVPAADAAAPAPTPAP